MPTRPPTFRRPGAPARTERAAQARWYDQHARRGRQVYGSNQWRQLSERHRGEHPLCEDCKAEGRATEADVVDHIQPIETHPELAFEPTNLRSLCHAHHARKTANDATKGG